MRSRALGGEEKTIQDQVRKLHHLVRFTAPPLELADIFEKRPDLQLKAGGEETPLEIQSEGDRLIIIVPPADDLCAERMLLAHALGHAMLHPVPILCEGEWPEEEVFLEEPDEISEVLRESQAHSFALELLLPMEMVEEHTRIHVTLFMKGEEVESEVDRLVPIFGVPHRAIRARLHLLMERSLRTGAGGLFRND